MARFRRALVWGVALLTLTACEAGVHTAITPDADALTVQLEVTLTGPAARSLLDDPEAEAALLALAADVARSPLLPQRSADRWTLLVDADPERLPRVAGLTGVGSVTSAVDGNRVAVTVTLVRPRRLSEAYDTAVAGRPDAVDLRAALGAATTVSVGVTFPGGVIEAPASVGGVPLELGATSARARFALDEIPQGTTVTFVGSTSDSATGAGRWRTAIYAGLLAAGAWLVLVPSRSRRHQRGDSR